LQGLGTDAAGVEAVIAGIEAGRVKGLVLVRADLTAWLPDERTKRALEKLSYLVVVDSDQREVAQYADVMLPIATYAESDGTFTNHGGRVQRFWQAVKPAGDAIAGWRALADLLAGSTFEGTPDAESVFAALASEGGAFAGLAYDVLGSAGASAANSRASA
jgi:predicted molibdopterin-dependent oxidoreductase YjgC